MSKSSESVIRAQKRKKEKVVELFGGECSICGYKKCIAALEFHHLNKDEKEEKPSYIIMRWSIERAKKELDKCILVCANCHREIHASENKIDIDLKILGKPWLTIECLYCGKDFSTKNKKTKYCSIKCYNINKTIKGNIPSKEDLIELKKTTNWTQLGRMFNVSDNAVRYWAKKYEIIQ